MRSQERILFVDDEDVVRHAFAETLAERGFQVDVARGASEALRLAAERDYAVIATDLRMPNGDGLALIEALRPRRPDAAYLLVTGVAPLDLPTESAGARGIDGIITKPWSIDELANALLHALQLHQERRSSATRADGRAVLLVEDDPDDAARICELLTRLGEPHRLVHVRRLGEALPLLAEQPFRLALVSLTLPDSHGLDTVLRVQAAAPEVPLVVLSRVEDEPVALQSMRAGAQDYLVKGTVDAAAFGRALRYAIERKRAQRRLAYLAHHDPLTGLANRASFRDRLSRAIARARDRKSRLAVLFLDLDRFKSVNEALGHDTGDLLIEEIVRRLVTNVREADAMARLGGDEFALVLENVRTEADASRVAARILAVLADPFRVRGQEIAVTGSIGVAFYPDHGVDFGQLVKSADVAMQRAKEGGRNTYRLFDAEMQAWLVERLALERDVRGALERRELCLFYQPQFRREGRRLVGVEALLRWRHPTRGIVGPDRFIPLLEETGLILPVGEWVLTTACRQVAAWQAAGLDGLRLAVNLSARQFESDELAETIASVLGTTGLPSASLELEITESLLMADTERTKRILASLKALGVRIAIDDFGTGYSSLAYLKRFPIDVLKIDRSFVKDITEDPDDAAIAEAIVGLGRSLRLSVIAEGVETEEQLARLEGCEAFQGYLGGRPEPPELLFPKLRRLALSPLAS